MQSETGIMKDLYEIGIVFRGFLLVNHKFKKLPVVKDARSTDVDLRSAFISAITTFAESAFGNTSLEYLEMQNFLFIFKINLIQPSDNNEEEPVILYGLVERKRKNADKFVRKFFEKATPIIELFKQKYNHKDFTELDQFKPFSDEMRNFFM